MSTRANIVIKETYSDFDNQGKETIETEKLFFYRHSDGYPEGAMATLSIFMKWLKEGKIRNNIQQAAGWLILLGAMEYNSIPSFATSEPHFTGGKRYGDTDTIGSPEDWKCGSIEPSTCIHGDIEFLYVIDLTSQGIKCYEDWTDEGEGKGTPVNLKQFVTA